MEITQSFDLKLKYTSHLGQMWQATEQRSQQISR